jgi:hypothetical protein
MESAPPGCSRRKPLPSYTNQAHVSWIINSIYYVKHTFALDSKPRLVNLIVLLELLEGDLPGDLRVGHVDGGDGGRLHHRCRCRFSEYGPQNIVTFIFHPLHPTAGGGSRQCGVLETKLAIRLSVDCDSEPPVAIELRTKSDLATRRRKRKDGLHHWCCVPILNTCRQLGAYDHGIIADTYHITLLKSQALVHGAHIYGATVFQTLHRDFIAPEAPTEAFFALGQIETTKNVIVKCGIPISVLRTWWIKKELSVRREPRNADRRNLLFDLA